MQQQAQQMAMMNPNYPMHEQFPPGHSQNQQMHQQHSQPQQYMPQQQQQPWQVQQQQQQQQQQPMLPPPGHNMAYQQQQRTPTQQQIGRPGHFVPYGVGNPQQQQQQQMPPPPMPPPPPPSQIMPPPPIPPPPLPSNVTTPIQPGQQPPPNTNLVSNSLPLPLQPEYRIFEMNKRLANRPEIDPGMPAGEHLNVIALWHEQFVNEFFADDLVHTRLTIRNVADEQGLARTFSIGRMLIARFFRSFGEGGCTEVSFQLGRGPGHTQLVHRDLHSQTIVFETDSCTMSTQHGRPMFAKVCAEGHLRVEFVQRFMPQQTPPSAQPPVTNQPHILIPAEPLKIMQWVFTIRRHVELIPRSAIAIQQDPHMIEQLSRNITRTGLTMQTFNYLKLCSIVESMQELMVKNKMTGAPPKECLRQAVVQRMHQMQHRIPGNQSRPGSVLIDELNSPIKSEPSKPLPGSSSSNQSPSSSGSSSPAAAGKRRKRKSSTGSTNEPLSSSSSSSSAAATPGSGSGSKKAESARAKKTSAAAAAAAAAALAAAQAAQQQPGQYAFNNNTCSNDVMVVGEPSLMGGDFGEEDERLITRLENNQFGVAAANETAAPFGNQRHPLMMEQPIRPASTIIQPHPPRPQSTSNFGQLDPSSLINSSPTSSRPLTPNLTNKTNLSPSHNTSPTNLASTEHAHPAAAAPITASANNLSTMSLATSSQMDQLIGSLDTSVMMVGDEPSSEQQQLTSTVAVNSSGNNLDRPDTSTSSQSPNSNNLNNNSYTNNTTTKTATTITTTTTTTSNNNNNNNNSNMNRFINGAYQPLTSTSAVASSSSSSSSQSSPPATMTSESLVSMVNDVSSVTLNAEILSGVAVIEAAGLVENSSNFNNNNCSSAVASDSASLLTNLNSSNSPPSSSVIQTAATVMVVMAEISSENAGGGSNNINNNNDAGKVAAPPSTDPQIFLSTNF